MIDAEFVEPNYYAIIPANVRYSKDISANAKLLYAEITALCNMNGKCFASNEYFSILYGVSIRSIQAWLKELKHKEYISIVYEPKQNGKRYIKLNNEPSQVIKDKLPNIDNKVLLDEQLQKYMKKIGLKK